LVSFLVRGADHMLSEKSQWTQNGTMFVDLDWLLNTSSPLSASAELLVVNGFAGLNGHVGLVQMFTMPNCAGIARHKRSFFRHTSYDSIFIY